jgi:hypothetical protein
MALAHRPPITGSQNPLTHNGKVILIQSDRTITTERGQLMHRQRRR